MTDLPTDSKARKELPIGTGVLDYFPDALAAVAEVSFKGNEKHNPGEPLHWAREKSTDHPDCMIRHFLERGKLDEDGDRHSAKMAWRALAILQLEIEAARPMTATEVQERHDAVTFRGVEIKPGAVIPTTEGWVEWEGGECPVSPDTLVDVRVCQPINTREEQGWWLNKPAGQWMWGGWGGGPSEIVAYRVVD